MTNLLKTGLKSLLGANNMQALLKALYRVEDSKYLDCVLD